MEFDKNKDELKNLEILRREIQKVRGPYSKILIDSLFSTTDSETFRSMIKTKLSQYIDGKIKK